MLEMVLVLPFLMMLLASIVIFGYAAMWKLRAETVSRDVVWRQRWTRFANIDVRAPEWPDPPPVNAGWVDEFATYYFGGARPLQDLIGEPVLDDPVIVGPLPAIEVDDSLLDYTRGMLVGNAATQQYPPIFAALIRYDFDVDHSVLDDRFQFHQMGIGNYTRRFPVIYQTAMDTARDSTAILAAVNAIVSAPSWPLLEALDRDREFIAYWGYAPDFYPRIRQFASTDQEWVRAVILQALFRRIERVPVTMGRATIRLYSEQLVDRPELQATIDAIEAWLLELEERNEGGGP